MAMLNYQRVLCSDKPFFWMSANRLPGSYFNGAVLIIFRMALNIGTIHYNSPFLRLICQNPIFQYISRGNRIIDHLLI